ncbi:hypothetical protein HPP92_028490 [Vanilla planifolia]|uniref:Uncharacterized protein n=1 Tax=Vanilla planifolia TaxID=51239 RepID=A0A835PAV9_VANPL|nr:hypothetical protein HPP92_028490 [Vanilla planifolia]
MLKEMTIKEVLGLTSMELSYAFDEMYTKTIVNYSHVGVILRVICSSETAQVGFASCPSHSHNKEKIVA